MSYITLRWAIGILSYFFLNKTSEKIFWTIKIAVFLLIKLNNLNNFNFSQYIQISFKLLGNIFDVGWWADKINSRTGVYELAKKTKFRKWQEGLTGWKFWAWQIVGGITFVVIMEFILNKIGMTMLPWR